MSGRSPRTILMVVLVAAAMLFDLESLRAEFVGVVGDTLQPAHASLWLREAER